MRDGCCQLGPMKPIDKHVRVLIKSIQPKLQNYLKKRSLTLLPIAYREVADSDEPERGRIYFIKVSRRLCVGDTFSKHILRSLR